MEQLGPHALDNSTGMPEAGVDTLEAAGYWVVTVMCSILIVLCLAAAFKLYRTSGEGFKFDQVMTGVETLRVRPTFFMLVSY